MWKGPAGIKVRAEPNDDYALPDLWDTIVCRVQESIDYVIGQPLVEPRSVMLLQNRKMLFPSLILSASNFRVLELEKDIIKVGTKGLAEQAFDIFEDERLWTSLSYGADSFRKHVSLVIVRLMLSAKRKWLTRRTTRDKTNSVSVPIIMDSANIGLKDFPVFDSGISMNDIIFYVIAGIRIPLE